MKLNFGCDPEFFACYMKDGKEHVMPTFQLEREGLVPLNDDWKHPLYLESDNFRFVGDGVALELNLRKPYQDVHEFYSVIQESIQALRDRLLPMGYSLSQRPTINFDWQTFCTKAMLADSRVHNSVIFGCDPDLDAFNVDWLAKVLTVEEHPFRYGGGHIHVSGSDSINEFPVPYVMLLALLAGNLSTAMSPYPDLELGRAMYYGKPGKYRIQHYPDGSSGVEYRTPSNSWTNLGEDKLRQLLDCFPRAVYLLEHRDEGKKALADYAESTIEAITTANQTLAMSVYEKLI